MPKGKLPLGSPTVLYPDSGRKFNSHLVVTFCPQRIGHHMPLEKPDKEVLRFTPLMLQ